MSHFTIKATKLWFVGGKATMISGVGGVVCYRRSGDRKPERSWRVLTGKLCDGPEDYKGCTRRLHGANVGNSKENASGGGVPQRQRKVARRRRGSETC
jgi:hypothetical protein